jgi:hypothetical protein
MLVGVVLVDQKTDIAMACIIPARSSLDHDDSRPRTARLINLQEQGTHSDEQHGHRFLSVGANGDEEASRRLVVARPYS